jgi:tellurite resistance protein TerC
MFASSDDDEFDIENSRIVKLTTRFIPITKDYDGEKFFIRRDGKLMGTLAAARFNRRRIHRFDFRG